MENLSWEIEQLKHKMQTLEHRLMALEGRQTESPRSPLEMNKSLPDTDLLSHSFLRRAFAVFGHGLVAQLIVIGPIWLLIMILVIIVGTSGR